MDHAKGGLIGAMTGLIAELVKFNWMMYLIYIIVSILDILTGALYHWVNGTFDSTTLGRKTMKKVNNWLIIFALYLANIAANQVGFDWNVTQILVGIYVFVDLISMMENTGGTPKVVILAAKKVLALLKGEIDVKEEEPKEEEV